MSDEHKNGYKLADQYRSGLLALISSLVIGAYAFIFFAQQFDERERERLEIRQARQFDEIIKRLKYIERQLPKRYETFHD